MGNRTGGKWRSASAGDGPKASVTADDEDWLCPTNGCCGVWYDIDEDDHRPFDAEPAETRPTSGGSSSPIIRMDASRRPSVPRRVDFTQTDDAANSRPQSAAAALPPPPVASSTPAIDALSMTQPIMIYATNPNDLAVAASRADRSANITARLQSMADEERADRERIRRRRFPSPPPTAHHHRIDSNTTTSSNGDRRQRRKLDRQKRRCRRETEVRDARHGLFHLEVTDEDEWHASPGNKSHHHSDGKMANLSEAKANGFHRRHHRQPCTSPPQRLVVWDDDAVDDVRNSDLRRQLLRLQAQLLGATLDGSGYVKMTPLVDLIRQKTDRSLGAAKKDKDDVAGGPNEKTASTFVRYQTLRNFMGSVRRFSDRIETKPTETRPLPAPVPPSLSGDVIVPQPVGLPVTAFSVRSESSAPESQSWDESRNERKLEQHVSNSVSSESVKSAKRRDAATETTGSICDVSTFRSNTASAADLASTALDNEGGPRPETVESAAQTEDPSTNRDDPMVDDASDDERVRDRKFTAIPLSIQRSPTLLSATARLPQRRSTRRRRTLARQAPSSQPHSPSPSTRNPTTPTSSGHLSTANKFTFPSKGLLNVPHTPTRNQSHLALPSPRNAKIDADVSSIRIPAQRIVRARRAFNTRNGGRVDAEQRVATDNETTVQSHSGTPLPLIQTLQNDRRDNEWRPKSPPQRQPRRNPSKRTTNDSSKHDFNMYGLPDLTISPRINDHRHHHPQMQSPENPGGLRRAQSPEEMGRKSQPKHKIRCSSVRHDRTSIRQRASSPFARGGRRALDSPPTSVVQHAHHTAPIIKPPHVRRRPRGQQVVVRALSGGSLAASGNSSTAGRHRRARSVRICALPPPTRTQFVVGRPYESRPVYLSTPESSFVTSGPRSRSTSEERDRSTMGTQLTMTPLSVSVHAVREERQCQKTKKRKARKTGL